MPNHAYSIDELAAVGKALADPGRLRVLAALGGSELCVCQIVELLGLAPSTVSRHMSVLQGAGLVRSRGTLDPRALHRLASRTSPRVFRKRKQKKGGHTACSLLVDVSASMRGEQIELCRKLALVFAETLATLGFPTEIIAFSTWDKDLRYELAQKTGVSEEELSRQYSCLVPLYHAIFKSFGEPWRKAAARLGSLRSKCLTPLGESLVFTAKRLTRRPERRKVLFCLTDGKPVVGAWDEQVTFDHACSAVERITRAGIEPVGIGIQEGSVEELFGRSAVIYELEELPRRFISELRKVLSGR